MPPKDAEKSTATSEAPVKERTRNSAGSTSGLRLAAVEHEQPEQHQRADEDADRRGRAPPPVVPLDQRRRSSAPTPGGHQHRAERRRAVDRVAGNGGQPAPADDQRRDADGDVDQEHPAPARRHQQAPDHRAERRGHAADRSPRPDRATTALGREGGQHQAERGRGEQCRPCRLDQAERRPASARWWRAAQAAEATVKTATPSRKPWSAAVPVGQPAEEHEQRRVDDGVPVEHPGQLAEVVAARSPRAMSGSATLTMNRSRLASTTPAQTMRSTWFGEASRRGVSADGRVCWLS